jgi:hypothetical protein
MHGLTLIVAMRNTPLPMALHHLHLLVRQRGRYGISKRVERPLEAMAAMRIKTSFRNTLGKRDIGR